MEDAPLALKLRQAYGLPSGVVTGSPKAADEVMVNVSVSLDESRARDLLSFLSSLKKEEK
jgi:hypothetical protein